MALTNGVHTNGGANGETLLGEDTQTSPYTTRAINVLIGPNGTIYNTFLGMVEPYPGLQARMNHKKPGTPIELPEVDEDIGHTLIHFIFTKNYRTLGLGGLADNVRATAEFKRSVLAYCAARLCTIEQLEEVTKSKMEHFGKQISIFDMQEVVAEISPKLPPNEIWFPEHLYRWIKEMLQENDGLVTDERLLDLVGKSPLFDKAVVKSIAEMYSEKDAAVKHFSNAETRVEIVAALPMTNGNHDSSKNSEQLTSESTMPAIEEIVEPVSTEQQLDEHPPYSADNEASSHQVLEAASEVKPPEPVLEDWSVKPDEIESNQPESAVMPEQEPESGVGSPALNAKEDELAKIDSASKATDSDVEAARAKTKKKKNKGKKKGSSEAQMVA